MRIIIRGHNLPGLHWATQDAHEYRNVHVGVQERRDPVGLVSGDAKSAEWCVDVSTSIGTEGEVDFKGPSVHGKRHERFLYLTWGEVTPDRSFRMFRRAKLMLGAVDPDLVRKAATSDGTLIAEVDLTDECGGPRCARVHPPALVWSLDARDRNG